jgi:hypothetical protein
MLRTLLLLILATLAAPALAVYKCESGGKVTYSDEPCPGGKVMELGNTQPQDAAAMKKQLAEEKKKSSQLEKERHHREAVEEKERLRTAHTAAAKQKRCSLLARRKRWADEDVAATAGKSADRARLKARRVSEQFDAECGR